MNHEKKPFFSFSFSTLLRLAFVCFAFALITRVAYYSITEGFCLQRIQTKIPIFPNLEIDPPSTRTIKTLSTATNQPFYYLKKGSQAYAFISKDRKYILKLFKYHHMQPADWLLSLPLPFKIGEYRDFLVQRRQHKINLTLNSYKIAATKLQDECALLYVQIIPSNAYQLPVTITDAIGRAYTIDLSEYGFAIQKRATLVLPSIKKWVSRGQLTEAKKALSSLIGLMARRSKKAIQDSDPDLHKNAGFIGTTAIHIDIGSFFENPRITESKHMQHDVKKIFSKLCDRLETLSPELFDHQHACGVPETL